LLAIVLPHQKVTYAASHPRLLIWPPRQCSQIATGLHSRKCKTVTQFKPLKT
jgi:hypothetical protein